MNTILLLVFLTLLAIERGSDPKFRIPVIPSPDWRVASALVMCTLCQLILWIPLFIYRALVITFVEVFKPSFGNILSPSSFVLCEKDKDVDNGSIVSTLKLEGNLDIEQLKDLVETNVVQARIISKQGHSVLRYPELKQFHSEFMGYRFWEEDPNFKIENHVFEEVPTEWGALTLQNIHERMLNRTIPPNRSPWEIALFRSCEGEDVHSHVALRMHHSMADAKSILKLLVECLGDGRRKKVKSARARHPKLTFKKISLNLALFPVHLIRVMMALYKAKLMTKGHAFRVRNSDKDSSPLIVAFSQNLSLEDVKSIARVNKVRVTPVIVSLITGAIVQFDKNSKLFDKMTIGFALPKWKHPTSLKSHFLPAFLDIPTGESSIRPRLRRCNTLYNRMASSMLPNISYNIAFIVGHFVKWLKPLLPLSTSFAAGLTNVAGEKDPFSVGGLPCVDFGLSCAIPKGSMGVMFIAFSYRDTIRFTVITKGSVMSKVEAQTLANLVVDEFTQMKKACLDS